MTQKYIEALTRFLTRCRDADAVLGADTAGISMQILPPCGQLLKTPVHLGGTTDPGTKDHVPTRVSKRVAPAVF